jgi:hypothetical protein
MLKIQAINKYSGNSFGQWPIPDVARQEFRWRGVWRDVFYTGLLENKRVMLSRY